MPKGTPFYLQDPFVNKINKRPLLLKRELARLFGDDPDGNRIQYEAARYALGLLAIGALVTTLVVAPGAGRGILWLAEAVRQSNDPYAKKLAKYQYLKRVIERLHRQRFIEVAQVHKRESIVITDRGRAKLMSYAIGDLAVFVPNKWDKKWRIVAFDIPEQRKIARNTLRAKLRELGFLQLQKSLFVYPYPCGKEVDFIAEIFGVWPHLTFFETGNLGRQEAEARKHFELF